MASVADTRSMHCRATSSLMLRPRIRSAISWWHKSCMACCTAKDADFAVVPCRVGAGAASGGRSPTCSPRLRPCVSLPPSQQRRGSFHVRRLVCSASRSDSQRQAGQPPQASATLVGNHAWCPSLGHVTHQMSRCSVNDLMLNRLTLRLKLFVLIICTAAHADGDRESGFLAGVC